jgi:DNA transformation protein and related proteins
MADVDDTIDATTRGVIDLLAPIGPVVAQRLFGTWGLYLEDRIFGLVDAGQTYFRTSDATIARYVDAGSCPFVYRRSDGIGTVMEYHEVPPEVLADRDRACAWAYEAAGAEP